MNTQYLTYILRLHIDDRDPLEPAGDKVFGSVQQVGLEEIHYFDSLEKFQETFKEMINGKSD